MEQKQANQNQELVDTKKIPRKYNWSEREARYEVVKWIQDSVDEGMPITAKEDEWFIHAGHLAAGYKVGTGIAVFASTFFLTRQFPILVPLTYHTQPKNYFRFQLALASMLGFMGTFLGSTLSSYRVLGLLFCLPDSPLADKAHSRLYEILPSHSMLTKFPRPQAPYIRKLPPPERDRLRGISSVPKNL